MKNSSKAVIVSSSTRLLADRSALQVCAGRARNDAALVQDRDAIGQLQGLGDVVRDDDDSACERRLDAHELGMQLRPGDRIGAPNGSSINNKGEIRGQCACQSDALPLST